MYHLFGPVLLAVLFVSATANGQTEKLFAACVEKTGPAYRQARDQFLDAKPDKAFLEQKQKSASWSERLTADILLGWLEHGPVYRQLLETKKIENQKGDAYYPWALNPDDLDNTVLPLMWELLGKDPDNAFDGGRVVIALTQEEKVDLQWCHHYLKEQPKAPEKNRHAIAWVLASVPPPLLKSEEVLQSLQAELAGKTKDRDVAESLLQALAGTTRRLPVAQKNQLVRDLLNLRELNDLVDPATVLYAVGNIGGDQAAQIVTKHLEGSRALAEQCWSLQVLGKMESVAATATLVKHVKQEKQSAMLRGIAIESLGESPYTDEAGATLRAVLLDEGKSKVERQKAMRSLGSLYRSHRGDKKLEQSLRTLIDSIDPAKLDDPNLQRGIGDLKKLFQEPK
ncbi:MAG: hypothetical protein ACK4RK_15645 [Gemmataceae bacterium]